MAGNEIVATWREAGMWWEDEPAVEWKRVRKSSGRIVDVPEELGCIYAPSREDVANYVEEHREEPALRPRKSRNQKVAHACGYAEQLPQVIPSCSSSIRYAPLHVLSGYSFARSTLFAKEIPRLCAARGFKACAITDRMSLTGAVEFVHDARRLGIKPLVGACLELEDGGEIVLIARDKQGYVELSRLLTQCHLEEPRLYPICSMARIQKTSGSLLLLTGGDKGPLNRLVSRNQLEEAKCLLCSWIDHFTPKNIFVEIDRSYLPWQNRVNARLLQLADELGVTCVAGGAITHSQPADFAAQDVMVCSETLCTVDEIIGRKPTRHPSKDPTDTMPVRELNGERYLRSSDQIIELYRDSRELLENTWRVVDMCDDDVLPSRTRLPSMCAEPNQALRQLVFEGAQARHHYVSQSLHRRLEFEIDRITSLNFTDHFLIMHDVCRWAREHGILHSGRGSVVDSAVAYYLGLSRIDAFTHKLHFDRFLPAGGDKRPDIDIDFEARRRDDVRNYVVQKYGKDRVATVAAIGAYCSRGIVREVGKALGLSQSAISFLAKRVHGAVSPQQLEAAIDKRPELRHSIVDRNRYDWVYRLAKVLADLPRNIRAHSSGVVISADPICETVPVMWSASEQEDSLTKEHLRIIQWDKRSAKHYFDKFDILCLRGQDVLSGTQERIRVSTPDFQVEQLSLEDADAYRAMGSGELIGIPQSASPAMRQAHIRIRTQNLHDASLVQAGIRPGVGGAVKINELIARRRGDVDYTFEHPELERILGLTYGIIVFQEQVDQLLQTFCGYSSGEAEDIRDEIHKRRREDYGQTIREELISRCHSKGFSEAVANKVFELVSGFKGYGFAQGHALAFAEISVRSVQCQQNYPAEYFAALLDAQPAGYYGSCTLVNEARTRGVKILHPCVQKSDYEFTVEDVRSELDPKILVPNSGIRVGLRQVALLEKECALRIVASRKAHGEFLSIGDFVHRTTPTRTELEQLILCGALDCFSTNRRKLLWAIPDIIECSQRQRDVHSLDFGSEVALDGELDDSSYAERCIRERVVLGLDIEEHLMAFERDRILSKGGITCAEAKRLGDNESCIVVGNPIRLRFPPTASGKRVVFFDLEDETGLLNVTAFDDVYQRDGHAIVCSPYVTLIGNAQLRDGHVAFLTRRAFPYQPEISYLVHKDFDIPVETSDFLVG